MELATIAEPMPISCKDSANQLKYKIKLICFYFRAQPFLWNRQVQSE